MTANDERDVLIAGDPLIAVLRQDCGAPAPLVVNGGSFVGCQKPKGHDGGHRVELEWR